MAFGFGSPALGGSQDESGLDPNLLASLRAMMLNPAGPGALSDTDGAQASGTPLGFTPVAHRQQAPGEGQGASSAGGALADRIVGVESGGNATAKNPRSSATGAGQFIDSTWLDMVGKYRPDLAGMPRDQILGLRNDATLSREMVQHYAEENGAKLRSAGLPDNDGTRYLSHFAGPAGARSVLSADPSTPVSQVLQPGQVTANPFVRSMTAGDLAGWAAKKVGSSAPTMTVPGESSGPAAFGFSGPTQAPDAGTTLPAGGAMMTMPSASDGNSSLTDALRGLSGMSGGGDGKGGQKDSGLPAISFRPVRPRPFGFMAPMKFSGQRS